MNISVKHNRKEVMLENEIATIDKFQCDVGKRWYSQNCK
jgi:hypothetical protein